MIRNFLAVALILASLAAHAQVNPVYRQDPVTGNATQQQQITIPNGFGITVRPGATITCQAGASCTGGTASSVPLSGIAGLGTGVQTALAIAVGSPGSPVVNGGAIGAATGTTLALGGASLSGNAFAVTGGGLLDSVSVTGSSSLAAVTGTTLALGGASIGTNALAVTGDVMVSHNVTVSNSLISNTITSSGKSQLNLSISNGFFQFNNNAGTAGFGIDGTTDGVAKFRNRANSADAAVTASGYTAAGVAGVSCAANTVNLTTFTVTNGIVTHC